MISTHILDTSIGQPAAGVKITLEIQNGDQWLPLFTDKTDEDGRVGELVSAQQFKPGNYRLRFATGEYFTRQQKSVFYPQVDILVQLEDCSQHYHIPLLLSPFGYSTYRGS